MKNRNELLNGDFLMPCKLKIVTNNAKFRLCFNKSREIYVELKSKGEYVVFSEHDFRKKPSPRGLVALGMPIIDATEVFRAIFEMWKILSKLNNPIRKWVIAIGAGGGWVFYEGTEADADSLMKMKAKTKQANGRKRLARDYEIETSEIDTDIF